MVHSFIFPQETIASIQERIKFLESCLNDGNPEDEAMAEILELANSRHVSPNELKEEARQMLHQLHKFMKLDEKLREKEQQGNLSILLFVRYNFLYKHIIDQYWDFFLNKQGREAVKAMTLSLINFYMEFKKEVDSKTYQKDEIYIIEETLKHIIPSVITVAFKFNVLTEEKLNAFNLRDITPQETETMLTSLASTQKWDWVYKNLA